MVSRPLPLLLVAAVTLIALTRATSAGREVADILLPDEDAYLPGLHVAYAPVRAASPVASVSADEADDPTAAARRQPLPFRLPHGPRRLKRSVPGESRFARRGVNTVPLDERASSVLATRRASVASQSGGGGTSESVAPAASVPETTTTATVPGSAGVVSTGLLTKATASPPAAASAAPTSAASDAQIGATQASGGGKTVTAFETASTGVVVTETESDTDSTMATLESAAAAAAASSGPATALAGAAVGRPAPWAGWMVGGALVALALR